MSFAFRRRDFRAFVLQRFSIRRNPMIFNMGWWNFYHRRWKKSRQILAQCNRPATDRNLLINNCCNRCNRSSLCKTAVLQSSWDLSYYMAPNSQRWWKKLPSWYVRLLADHRKCPVRNGPEDKASSKVGRFQCHFACAVRLTIYTGLRYNVKRKRLVRAAE